jgi:putative phosphoribosyl transferase
MQFIDRQTAGKELARCLRHFQENDVVVAALPRGGIVLGFEVANTLKAPLGLILVRKIGHPAYAEYAIAAVAEGEEPTYSETELLPVDDLWLGAAEHRARQMIEGQRRLYFTDDYVSPEIQGNTVIIVDDGMATGLTMHAAVRSAKRMHPAKTIVAVPVASRESVELLERLADEIIVLDKPRNFLGSIGAHYIRFPQISDLTVRQLLERSRLNDIATHLNSPVKT